MFQQARKPEAHVGDQHIENQEPIVVAVDENSKFPTPRTDLLPQQKDTAQAIRKIDTEDLTDFSPKERSSCLNKFLVILVSSGNYFFGYQLVIVNVMAEAMLRGVYKQTEEDFKQNSGNLGLLFSVGCLVGVVLQGKLTK